MQPDFETGLNNARLMTRQAPKLRVASFRPCMVDSSYSSSLPSSTFTPINNPRKCQTYPCTARHRIVAKPALVTGDCLNLTAYAILNLPEQLSLLRALVEENASLINAKDVVCRF